MQIQMEIQRHWKFKGKTMVTSHKQRLLLRCDEVLWDVMRGFIRLAALLSISVCLRKAISAL